MKYCPLMSYAKQYSQEVLCLGEECALAADNAGQCLIKQALQCYVSAERTRVADEADRIRRETELAQTYWATKKDGTRTPIQFLQNGDTSPAKLQHGGVYDDLSDLRKEVKLGPPRVDGSYIYF